jgi:hypothetical protein
MFKSFRSGVLGMDVLVALGTTAAYSYAIISVIYGLLEHEPNMGTHFLETSSVLISFVLLGKYMQASATSRTSHALEKLAKLTPSTAIAISRRTTATQKQVGVPGAEGASEASNKKKGLLPSVFRGLARRRMRCCSPDTLAHSRSLSPQWWFDAALPFDKTAPADLVETETDTSLLVSQRSEVKRARRGGVR